MDRFIGQVHTQIYKINTHLKSNMDRFIDLESGGTGYATDI